jgi:hypothetical protein
MKEGTIVSQRVLNPPEIEPAPGWLERRAAHLVSEIHAPDEGVGRRFSSSGARAAWRLAGVVAVTLLVFAGATLAVAGVNPLDWVRGGGTSEARFSVDPSQTVRWPAPPGLACDAPATGEFACVPTSKGRWTYGLLQRVDPQPELSRAAVLAALAALEQDGVVTRARGGEIRAQIAAVDDEFFTKMSVLLRMQAVIAAHEVRPGVFLVPPDGVPQFVTCRPDGEGMACHDLRAAVVPVGAPIYGLETNEQWVEARARVADPGDGSGDLSAVFGRSLTRAEERLLVTLSEVVYSSGESGESDSGEG